MLLICYRRKRLSRDELFTSLIRLQQLPLITTRTSDSGFVLTLAERHNLTAYDAAYLALSIETGLPLATLDKQLISAAPKEGVALLS